MTMTSPAKIKVEKITQVAIAVHDVRMVAENYWNILGIGPWDFHDWEYPKVHHRTYCGEPSWSREKICMTDVGGVELELMQPIDGPSLYRDFMEEHGEGLHHVQFLVDDLDATVRILTEEYGFMSLQSGNSGPTEKGCRYHYVYIEPLACIWEPVECKPEARPKPDSRYPETAQASPAKLKVDRINQIALVVEDLEKTAENYWNLLGIGPWEIYEWGNPLVFDRKYDGRPSWGRERIAVTDVGGVQLELCQPVMGESVYRDFLDEHGEGLHHINFFADDVDKAADILAAQGFRSLQSGRHGPPELNEAFNYIDTKPLRTIWEPTHYDEKNIGAAPTIFPR